MQRMQTQQLEGDYRSPSDKIHTRILVGLLDDPVFLILGHQEKTLLHLAFFFLSGEIFLHQHNGYSRKNGVSRVCDCCCMLHKSSILSLIWVLKSYVFFFFNFNALWAKKERKEKRKTVSILFDISIHRFNMVAL